jgi:hypothetical protein
MQVRHGEQGLLESWALARGRPRLGAAPAADADERAGGAAHPHLAAHAQALPRLRAGAGAWAGRRGLKPTRFPGLQAPGAPGAGGGAAGIGPYPTLRARARGDVYCVLRCEGHVRRTALAPGRPAPAWHEDMAFKAVSIASDLQARARRATPPRMRAWALHGHGRPAGAAGAWPRAWTATASWCAYLTIRWQP